MKYLPPTHPQFLWLCSAQADWLCMAPLTHSCFTAEVSKITLESKHKQGQRKWEKRMWHSLRCLYACTSLSLATRTRIVQCVMFHLFLGTYLSIALSVCMSWQRSLREASRLSFSTKSFWVYIWIGLLWENMFTLSFNFSFKFSFSESTAD